MTIRMPLVASLARMLTSFSRAPVDPVVTEQMDVRRRRGGAFLEAGVAQGVHQDMVGGADEALDDPVARGPAGRVDQDLLAIQEFGDRLSSASDIEVLPTSAGDPALWTPKSRIVFIAVSMMAGCDDRLR